MHCTGYSTSYLTIYTVSSSSFFEHASIYCSYYEQSRKRRYGNTGNSSNN